ncbi:hypothetical protein [Clostridium sp.]|uniref:hypothetical protein n=1 Tax=Clostridium sp. TaxID=1506 RepID=UPI003D6D3528
MNIIGIKETNTSNYVVKNDTKKETDKNDENNGTSEIKGITQDLRADTFVKSTKQDDINLTYTFAQKKLSTKEVIALKEGQENIKIDFIKKFISDTINNQNNLLRKSTESGINEMSKETTDLLTKIFGSVENAYPKLATTPEGANEAIEEGGVYSVTAVADRIMAMAQSLAGDNPDKIQQMRVAVEKGFAQAGLDFKDATRSDLPQICKNTCSEVMKRFDELQNKTSSANE